MIKKNAKETKKIDFNIEVSRAKELDNGNIAFDMVANGVSIYGCFYKVLQRKDGSGEFAVRVGIPTKSGVGGGLIAVVDGEVGIGIYGPALDEKGNSVAGIAMLEYISREMGYHMFGSSKRGSPTKLS